MRTSTCFVRSLLFAIAFTISSWADSSTATHENNFPNCLALHSAESPPPIYSPKSPSYASILQSSLQNLRFASPTTRKPEFIITPSHQSHVQAAVICCRKHGFLIRVRSGGHDFEGLSYTAEGPFIIIDLVNLRSIEVNIEEYSAWVQAGATIGELYYRIAEKSPIHGFPAGICPTVGVGGHISGAGFGNLQRKYGVSADHVIDALLVNAEGEILNRELMGEDLFWAIRGGGGASFGIILSWRIKLVPVPPIVTVSTVERTLEQGGTTLFHKWQLITDKLPEDVYLGFHIAVVNTNKEEGGRTVKISFHVMFLGGVEKLLKLMEDNFPELGMVRNDCIEMSWIESTIYFAGMPNGTSLEALRDRTSQPKIFFKAKSDYITTPIPITGLEGLWKRLLEEDAPEIMVGPHGGRMNEISEHEIAFPHRAGNIYLLNYMVSWQEEGVEEAEKHLNWIRELYDYMGPYVSNSPRTAYFNFKDLDLGQNKNDNESYSEAKIWGEKYFKSNFRTLVYVKSKVDPDNFFKNEQSIPVLPSLGEKIGDPRCNAWTLANVYSDCL